MNSSVAQAVVRQRQWPYALVWVLPLLVAVLAGFYVKDFLSHRGAEAVIKFSDASGLMPGETRLLYRGAEVGRVTSISLSEDRRHALVAVRFHQREGIFASKGAQFWIVRPEVSGLGLKGLDTLMTGPYIQALPGKGEEDAEEFEGLAHEPLPYEAGERFVLTSSRLGHVQESSAVSYKGIQVGSVQEMELAPDASHVNIHILVWTRYAHLVRENTKFWVDSGFDLKGGILSGIHVTLDSLKTLVSGGVDFATPPKGLGERASSGRQFALDEDPPRDWQEWSPRLGIAPRAGDAAEQKVRLPSAKHRQPPR